MWSTLRDWTRSLSPSERLALSASFGTIAISGVVFAAAIGLSLQGYLIH